MTSKDTSLDRSTARATAWRAMRYQSARRPKLRAAALVVPPPIPKIAAPQGQVRDSEPDLQEPEAEEVGLRVLAALESMQSLEPDYCDDVAAEASVTIIERANTGPAAPSSYSETYGSLRSRLHGMGVAPEIVPEEYAAYQGPIEEATVEIVERRAGGQNAAAATSRPDLPPADPASKA